VLWKYSHIFGLCTEKDGKREKSQKFVKLWNMSNILSTSPIFKKGSWNKDFYLPGINKTQSHHPTWVFLATGCDTSTVATQKQSGYPTSKPHM
jgi:hypothetical protein